MSTDQRVTVRLLAYLHLLRSEQGLPSTFTVAVPADGMTAAELASELELPTSYVEGVFHNHKKSGLDCLVLPGDRVAFVPPGTPASHPAFFGAFQEVR